MSIQKTTDSSSLAEVIDRILDKGIVIDAFARVSLVGIEILTVDARVVIASVDTWLRYAEAVGLLRNEGYEEEQSTKQQDTAFTI
ncbi:gas vesicle protein GvpJ [Gracilibacillus xinjiangensis]|uniref:Gas vesicle protein A n=1 Tax=Gracilibacillus xinjiangensis TaxID=1193282 RepID=A0ABV8WWJ2_9BACI